MTELVDLAESAIARAVPAVRGARLIAWAVVALVAIAVIAFALWWLLLRPIEAQRAAAQAKVDGQLGKATGDVAVRALPVINDAARQRVEVDVKVQKGTADVRSAPDAGVEVRGVSDALRHNLCLYGAYATDPDCKPMHEDPAGVGAARPDGPGAARPD
jgi:hypothetical protein